MKGSSVNCEYTCETAPLQALCSSNLPKLLERDTPLFIAILGDLFPRKALPMPSHDSLHRGVAAAAKTLGLQSLEEQMTKVDQLHETMEVSTIRFQAENHNSHVLFDLVFCFTCTTIVGIPATQRRQCISNICRVVGFNPNHLIECFA